RRHTSSKRDWSSDVCSSDLSYEKALFAQEELVSNVISKQSVRDEIRDEIAKKARVRVEDVMIDVPTLPSVPYHNAVEIQPLDIRSEERRVGKGCRCRCR